RKAQSVASVPPSEGARPRRAAGNRRAAPRWPEEWASASCHRRGAARYSQGSAAGRAPERAAGGAATPAAVARPEPPPHEAQLLRARRRDTALALAGGRRSPKHLAEAGEPGEPRVHDRGAATAGRQGGHPA